ncbi:hypothetical protein SETIT_3G289700v2 [Setaria italica]|uniref:Uncharacterized protein n=1 Tax=Setaria italica TaxID=4555 RepID=K3ZAV0_SETIT|nr:hypothetical protein SETIT_3G289700v2 [Setaria italica]
MGQGGTGREMQMEWRKVEAAEGARRPSCRTMRPSASGRPLLRAPSDTRLGSGWRRVREPRVRACVAAAGLSQIQDDARLDSVWSSGRRMSPQQARATHHGHPLLILCSGHMTGGPNPT